MGSTLKGIAWRLLYWWSSHVFFVSWHKHWKGIYLHFPVYTVRVFVWGVDWHRRRLTR